jgi:membrane protease YdiL (CAAX protease family)
MTLLAASPRARLAAALRDNRLLIAAELALVPLIQLLQTGGNIDAAIVYFLVLGWLSLWLRQRGWRSVGLRRPASWPRALALGLGVGLGYQAVSLTLLTPLLQHLAGVPLDLSQFAPLRGSLSGLLLSLVVSWLIGGLAEELVYRGYLLNRFAELFGLRPVAWAVGLLACAALFGLGHLYQGPAGVAENFLFSLVLGALYLAARRNLWPVILAHGFNNSLGLLLIYLGLYP